jgi:putative N6-adenine-specific DNA methylase
LSKFFVTCARGVEEITQGELRDLGIPLTEKVPGGVFFEGDQDALYRAHLWLRTGNRILLILRSFPVRNPDELYEQVGKFKWETFLRDGHTFAVDCTLSGRNPPSLQHSHFARLRAKDAIVDRLRDKTGSRPDVDTEDPDVSVVLYVRDGVCTLNMDATGPAPLHERGYRARNALAPLKETLAAAILKLAGWQPGQALVDPMCGSGTLVAEGALMAANIAPGSLRGRFAFMNWPDFHEPRWERHLREAEEARRALAPGQLFASDHDPEAVRQTKQAFKILGMSDVVDVQQRRFGDFRPPAVTPGWIVMNPPYGDRLGEVEKLRPLYRAMGDIFKQRCEGWNAGVFTGSAELMKAIGLKTKRKIPLWNGPIECRLLTFEMYRGSARPVIPEGSLGDIETSVLEPALETVHSLNKMEKTFGEFGREPDTTLEEFAAFTLLRMLDEGLLELHPDFSGKTPLSREEAEAALAEWADEGFEGEKRLGILASERGRALFAKREAANARELAAKEPRPKR